MHTVVVLVKLSTEKIDDQLLSMMSMISKMNVGLMFCDC